MYPKSAVRSFCEEKIHMAAILQTLLVNNVELRKNSIEILGNFFKYSGNSLIEIGLIDFLINCLNENTGLYALDLLYQIQKIAVNYNKDIDFSLYSISDQELIAMNEKIKKSVFLRFLPVPFVKIIVEAEDSKQILQLYTKENIEESTIIWSKGMRELLEKELSVHLDKFNQELSKFVDNKDVKFRKIKNMPIYAEIFKKTIKYPQIEKEVTCGEYYLRVWNNLKPAMERKNQSNFIKSLKLTFEVITSCLDNINLDDLEIVLNSYKLSSTT